MINTDPHINGPDDPAARAARAKRRADAARAQVRPGPKAFDPVLTLARQREEPAKCATCGGTMAIIEPRQTTHPGCAEVPT